MTYMSFNTTISRLYQQEASNWEFKQRAHMVKVSEPLSQALTYRIRDWCRANIKGRWTNGIAPGRNGESALAVYFDDDIEAMAFKLVFG